LVRKGGAGYTLTILGLLLRMNQLRLKYRFLKNFRYAVDGLLYGTKN